MSGLQRAFECSSVAVLRRADGGWRVENSAGEPVPERPEDAQVAVPLDADTMLAYLGAHRDSDPTAYADTLAELLLRAIRR